MAPIGTSSTLPGLNSVLLCQDSPLEDEFDSGNVFQDSMQDLEGAHDESNPEDEIILPNAGTSSRGRIRKLSHIMQDSISQCDFYGSHGMHCMGNSPITTTSQDA